MGFLSDFRKAKKLTDAAVNAQAKRAAAKATGKATQGPQVAVSATVRKAKPRGRSEVYADPKEFDPMPILTIRSWDYGQGLEPGSEGFGFTAPDGRIWPGKNCKITLWKQLGVLYQPVVGTEYHAESVGPEFAPGKPLRLVAEPENPHSDGRAIAVRNWANDKTAGYIPEDRVSRLRNLIRDQEYYVMCLNRRVKGGKVIVMNAAIWLPGRVKGCDDIPAGPPIADPPAT